MAHAAFTQSIYIAATPDAVKVSLADYSYHSAIHPMIVRVQVLDHTTGPDGTPLRRSKISDRMRMGPFTFAITYLATILEAADGTLVSETPTSNRMSTCTM
ncbi:MAG TPA: SRPBCC family protein [Ktedonobacterales bacterium]|nr:SRPBCC family protein [Ktedonobacterales bacterium]